MNEEARFQVIDQDTINYPIENESDIIGLSKDSRCDNNMHYLIFEFENSKQTWCIQNRKDRDIQFDEYKLLLTHLNL